MNVSEASAARRRKLVSRTAALATVSAMVTCSIVLSSAPAAVGQGGSWVQTTLEDFANGTGTNIDVESSPGSVKMETSLSTYIESSYNPGLGQGAPGTWDDSGLMGPVVLKEMGMYKMWYAGDDTGSGSYRMGYAISLDGLNWTKPRLGIVSYDGSTANNIFMDLGPPGSPEASAIIPGTVMRDSTVYHLWYSCRGTRWAICYASSTDGLHWQRHSSNPVLDADAPSMGAMAPTVHRNDPGYTMHFSEINDQWHYILTVADSPDGLDWNTMDAAFPPELGDAGSWYDGGIIPGSVEISGSRWRMWYAGVHGSTQSIGVKGGGNDAGAVNPLLNPVLRPGELGQWNSASLSRPSVMRDGPRYRMWFAGFDGTRWGIGTAASAFGERLVPPKTNPVLAPGNLESWDSGGVFRPSVLYKDGQYYMWYTGSRSANGSGELAIGLAKSTDGVKWIKHGWQPVFRKSKTGWDSAWVGFAWVIWDNSSKLFKMWYTGSDNTSVRIGFATSIDGGFWQRSASNPVALSVNISWFNVSDSGCPWVGEYWDGKYLMLTGTRTGGITRLARLHSSDGGSTWDGDEHPLLSPSPGTWESASVSCPVLTTKGTWDDEWIWYEGSRRATLPGFGNIGLLTSTNWGLNFSHSPVPVLNATKSWDVRGIGGPAVLHTESHARIFFHGGGDSLTSIGTAISYDEANWHETFAAPAVLVNASAPVNLGLSYPVVINKTATFPYSVMFFSALQRGKNEIVFTNTLPNDEWDRGIHGITIEGGSPGGWDSMGRKPSSALSIGGMHHYWYSGTDSSGRRSIGHATSQDYGWWSWQADPGNPILIGGPPGSWDSEGVDGATVVHPGLTSRFEMWYSGFDGTTWRVGFAFSDDGTNWTKSAINPVLYPSSTPSWDSESVFRPWVILEGGMRHMLYSGFDGKTWSLGQAFSKDGISWVKSKLNPLLGGSHSNGDPFDILDASVQMMDSNYRVWFSDSSYNSSAISFADSGFLSMGVFQSKTVDSGTGLSTWTTINVIKSSSSRTDVSISARVGSQPYDDIEWSEDSWSRSFAPKGLRDKTILFRLTFFSMTGEDTPIVDEVSGEYTLNQGPLSTPLNPVQDSCVGQARPRFNWTISDQEGDSNQGFILQVAEDRDFTRLRYSLTVNSQLKTHHPPYPLSDGMWFWRIQSWDYATIGPWSPPVKFCIDTIPPVTQIGHIGPHAGSSPTYISGSTQIRLNFTDSLCGKGKTFIRIDGVNWTQVSQALILSPGYHSIDFYSVDDAGNSENPRTETFLVDVNPPNTTLVVGGPRTLKNGVLYFRGDAPLVLDANDSESGPWLTQYSVDSVGNWVDDPVIMPLAPGLHTLYYRSVDRIGNTEITRLQQVFMDVDAPATSVMINGAQVPGSPVFVTPATEFNLSSTDTGAGVEGTYYKIDGDPIPRLYTGNFSIGSEGFHILNFYSEDQLNNTEQQRTLLLQVDGHGPKTLISPLGPSFVTATATYIKKSTVMLLAGSDNGSGLQSIFYTLNGGPWTRYSTAFDLSTDGPNTLSFYGIDFLGLVESINTVNLYVDEDPPSTQLQLIGTVVQSGGLAYIDQGTMVSLQASDAGSGSLFIRYRLDGSSWSVYDTPFPILGSGIHTVEFQAVDNLGTMEIAQMYRVTVDALSPIANAGQDIASFAPADVVLDGTLSTDDTTIVSYEWIAQWNGSVILRSAKGSVNLQSPGLYTFILRVRDSLGRESTDVVTVKLLKEPDSDGDLLPDIWEMARFGNLMYGPEDDPDGNGRSNLEEYGQQGGIDNGVDGNIRLQNGQEQGADLFLLVILTILGLLIGVVLLQWLKNRELNTKLGDREAEMSASFDQDETEDSPRRGSER